ncbi:MAG TPA: aquaporin [Gemmatimonadaceae bacterium]|jgi:MIP family channel proteins
MRESTLAHALRRYIVEFLGTFTLVAIGPGAAMVAARTHAFGQVGVSLAFGLAVILVVASSGHLSGAHINPAVTIGFWSIRRFPGRDVVPYVVAQCVGAIAASAVLVWILGPVGNFGATVPALPTAQAFAVEMGYTGILAFVIMGAATDERTPPAVVPFVIGATVCCGALTTGALTGGSFNPARTLGPAVVGGIWTSHWLYWAAPISGMVIGMHLYELLRTSRPPADEGVGAPAMGTEGPLDL